jgi:cell division protein FtsB
MKLLFSLLRPAIPALFLTAQVAAEQNAKTAQAQIAAVQAELAPLKARVAELEAEKAKAVVPPAVSK